MAEINDLLKKVKTITKIESVKHLGAGLAHIIGEGISEDGETVLFSNVVDMANDDVEKLVMPAMLKNSISSPNDTSSNSMSEELPF
jgi:hypothetical protein